MKTVKNILPFLLILFSANTWAVDLQAAADDVCACLEAPYEIVEKALGEIQNAQSTGDYSRMMEAQGEMMGVMNASNACFSALPEKYPEVDKDDELKEKVMQLADQQCPNPASGYSP